MLQKILLYRSVFTIASLVSRLVQPAIPSSRTRVSRPVLYNPPYLVAELGSLVSCNNGWNHVSANHLNAKLRDVPCCLRREVLSGLYTGCQVKPQSMMFPPQTQHGVPFVSPPGIFNREPTIQDVCALLLGLQGNMTSTRHDLDTGIQNLNGTVTDIGQKMENLNIHVCDCEERMSRVEDNIREQLGEVFRKLGNITNDWYTWRMRQVQPCN